MSTLPTAGHVAAFQLAGRLLLESRCNNSHSGNLSSRHGDAVIITRTRAMLGHLRADDLVVTSLTPTAAERTAASSELDCHLEVYRRTGHAAVAHGHALAAVAAAWLFDEIIPIDVEGAYYFGRIPVLEHAPATASPKLAAAVAEVLRESPVVVVRGHGVFAAGPDLETAAQRITSVNDSAELILRAQAAGLDIHQLQRKDYLKFPARP